VCCGARAQSPQADRPGGEWLGLGRWITVRLFPALENGV